MNLTKCMSFRARFADTPSGSPTLEVESDTSSKVCRSKMEIKNRSGTLIRGLVLTLEGLKALQKVGNDEQSCPKSALAIDFFSIS